MEKRGDEKKEKKESFIKKFSVVKILISLAIGFLPSFLFIAFFIQYGSPFSNYIKFLSNINSSWVAWVSAIIIALFVFLIMKLFGSRKNISKITKNRFALVLMIVSLFIIIALIAAQLSLYVNFTIGNDVLVKLSSDKENVFLTSLSQENVTFKISVTMNPFCTAECNYIFYDEASGNEIDTGAFNLTSISSKTKNYFLANKHFIQGSQEINRFEVSCKSEKTLLCYTSGDESVRSVLLTLNYNLTDNEQQFKNQSKNEIYSLAGKVYSTSDNLNLSLININLLNNSFSGTEFLSRYISIQNSSAGLNDSIYLLKNLWEIQNFTELNNQFPRIIGAVYSLENQSEQLNSDLLSDISLYNNLTDNLTSLEKTLGQISQENLTTSLCAQLNSAIYDFAFAISNFNNDSNLSDKNLFAENISNEISNLSLASQNSAGIPCQLTQPIPQIYFSKINPVLSVAKTNYTFNLTEPAPVCCFLGNCTKCCDQTCSDKNYPILFLHGHPINKALPADYSLDDLSQIKEKLISEGYIEAGAMTISGVSEEGGLLGKVNAAIMTTASYLFDTYREANGKETTVVSSTNSIDTYAIRLKSLVDLAKYRTGKNKVILIAHSMGGLVTRRYLQIFGGDSVDKIILIDVPNHGIDDKIESYCGLFGQGLECSEMAKDSLFLNNLNNNPTDSVPTYNVIGIGCDMGDETGDGIIKNSSQYLSYAKNYYVNGSCDELHFSFLHQYVVYPNLYPQTYEFIDEILKNSSLLK